MIRPIEPKDRETFLSFAKAFYSSDAVLHPIPPEHHEAAFREMTEGGSLLGYLLESEGKPVGYALLAKKYSHEAGGPELWLEELFLLPESRGKGLGQAFFRFLDSFAGKYRRIRLELEPDNTRAQSLYERMGYSPLGYSQMAKDLV